MEQVPKPPTLAAELYTALRLSPGRVRFMAIFTAVVCILSVGLSLSGPDEHEATVDVDVAAFAVSGTPAFELQSLTDDYLNALRSPATVRRSAEDTDASTDDIEGGISVRREENATRVTVAYVDTDVDRATEIATVVARNGLRDVARQRVSAATRDVEAARERVGSATSGVEAFETANGQRGIPDEFSRLTALVDELISQLAAAAPEQTSAIQAALADAQARRSALESLVREAEALEAELDGAQTQLLDASTRLSEANSQVAAAESDVVVQPGFTSEVGGTGAITSGLATGLVLGVLGSYGTSWLLQRRRTQQ